MLIASGDLNHIQVIKKSDLAWSVPLLRISYRILIFKLFLPKPSSPYEFCPTVQTHVLIVPVEDGIGREGSNLLAPSVEVNVDDTVDDGEVD